MTDMYDHASEIEDRDREGAIIIAKKAIAHEGTLECVVCHCEIEAARKRALPSSTRCIECQERHEKSRKLKVQR